MLRTTLSWSRAAFHEPALSCLRAARSPRRRRGPRPNINHTVTTSASSTSTMKPRTAAICLGYCSISLSSGNSIDAVSQSHADARGHLGLGGDGDQIGAALFPQQARVEHHVERVDVVRLAMEMRRHELRPAMI